MFGRVDTSLNYASARFAYGFKRGPDSSRSGADAAAARNAPELVFEREKHRAFERGEMEQATFTHLNPEEEERRKKAPLYVSPFPSFLQALSFF